MNYKSVGKLVYQEDPERCFVEVSQQLADYYLYLLKREGYLVQPTKYKPHITVIRYRVERVSPLLSKQELRSCASMFGEVEFDYDHKIRQSGERLVLDAWSDDVGNFRVSIGLPRYRVGFDRYHITVGRSKMAD